MEHFPLSYRPNAKTLLLFALLAFGLLLTTGAALWLNGNNNSKDQAVRLLRGRCPTSDVRTLTITATDGITNLCLTGLETMPIGWAISRDGSRFAYALPTGQTPPPASGPDEYFRKWEETNWYVMDPNGDNRRPFPPAAHIWLSLSVDGQYAEVPVRCPHTSMGNCESQIYAIDSESVVCRYSTFNTFFVSGSTNCTALPLRTGGVWNVKQEVDARGCAFWKQYGQFKEKCSTP